MSDQGEPDRTRAVTTLLARIESGDSAAAASLLPLVYSELRSLARSNMAREPGGLTLEPTALVHEAYVRLVGQQDPGWANRAHFFAAAARAMRRLLIERARRLRRIRHGGNLKRTDSDFETLDVTRSRHLRVAARAEEMLDLDRALERLALFDQRMVQVVELRFFGGSSVKDVAAMLEISERSVERSWTGAKAWLRRELGRSAERSISV